MSKKTSKSRVTRRRPREELSLRPLPMELIAAHGWPSARALTMHAMCVTRSEVEAFLAKQLLEKRHQKRGAESSRISRQARSVV